MKNVLTMVMIAILLFVLFMLTKKTTKKITEGFTYNPSVSYDSTKEDSSNPSYFHVINNYDGYIGERDNTMFSQQFRDEAKQILDKFHPKFQHVYDILSNLTDDEWKFVIFNTGDAKDGFRNISDANNAAFNKFTNKYQSNIMNVPDVETVDYCNPRLEECNFFKRYTGLDKLTFSKIVSTDEEFNKYKQSQNPEDLGVVFKSMNAVMQQKMLTKIRDVYSSIRWEKRKRLHQPEKYDITNHAYFVGKLQHNDLDEECYLNFGLYEFPFRSKCDTQQNLSDCDYQVCQRIHSNVDLPICYRFKGNVNDTSNNYFTPEFMRDMCSRNVEGVNDDCPQICKYYTDDAFKKETDDCFSSNLPLNNHGITPNAYFGWAKEKCYKFNTSYQQTGATKWCPIMCNQIKDKPFATQHELELQAIAKELVDKTKEYVNNRGIKGFSRTSQMKQTILDEETYKANQVANQILKMTVSPPNAAEEARLLNEATNLKNQTLKDTFVRLCNKVRKDRNHKQCVRRFRNNKTP